MGCATSGLPAAVSQSTNAPGSVMKQPILHIAPGMSAAGSMRMAVKMDGRPDEVIGLPDSLSFGRIDCTDPKTRGAWIEEVLGYEWLDVAQEIEQFWNRVSTADKPRVLWFSAP